MLIATDILVDILSCSTNRKHLNSIKSVNYQIFNCISHLLQDKPLHFVDKLEMDLKSNICLLIKGDKPTALCLFFLLAKLPIPANIRTLQPVIKCWSCCKPLGSGWDEIVAYLHHNNNKQSKKHRQLRLNSLDRDDSHDVLYLWRCLSKIFREDVCTRSYTLQLNFSCSNPYQSIILNNPTTNEQLEVAFVELVLLTRKGTLF
uniref:Uncharacterized protein n=1 Tax=Ditylenchus dipsaci TaxID=166011 RepID=A0A915EC60_9BILA